MTEIVINSPQLPKNTDVNILLVDDDPVVLEVLESFVASQGYSTALAGDGFEAVKMLHEKNFDIVITDINMPNMDGIELLQYIDKHYPDTGVMVVTGFSERYSYMDVINLGAIDYMSKPNGVQN